MSELMTQNMPEPKEPGLYLIAGEAVLPTVVVRCTDDLDKEFHWMMVGSTWMYNWEGILFEWLPSDIAYTIESLTEHDERIRDETAQDIASRYSITRGPLTQDELDKSQSLLDSFMSDFVKAPRLVDHDRDIASKAWREGHSAGEYDRLLGNIDISPNPYEIE
jgi:hypothetical protein